MHPVAERDTRSDPAIEDVRGYLILLHLGRGELGRGRRGSEFGVRSFAGGVYGRRRSFGSGVAFVVEDRALMLLPRRGVSNRALVLLYIYIERGTQTYELWGRYLSSTPYLHLSSFLSGGKGGIRR